MTSIGDGLKATYSAYQEDLSRRDRLLDAVGNMISPGTELPDIAHRETLLISALAKTIREFPVHMHPIETDQAVKFLRKLVEFGE